MNYEIAKKLYHYDPESGVLYHQRLGRELGTKTKSGHLRMGYKKNNTFKAYLVHRVIWLMMTGDWPKCDIDHINRIPDDNRWENLRLAHGNINQVNQGVRKDSRSGIKGVVPAGKKWRASVRKNGKQVHLGHYDTIVEAKAAYRAGSILMFGDYAHFEA